MKQIKTLQRLLSLVMAITALVQGLSAHGDTTPISESPTAAVSQSALSENSAINAFREFIRVYDNGIHNFQLYLKDAGENLKVFYAEYDDSNGEHHIWDSGVYFDTEAGIIYGDGNGGALGLGYDWDLNQMILYVPTNTWHRAYGYTPLYDAAAPFVFLYYDTIRFCFNYGGLDWMFQFWKGQYTICTGAEMGIYYKPEDRPGFFYDCATDEMMLPMSMKLYQGQRLLFERSLQEHWWLSGFKGGFSAPCMLRLDGSIVFRESGMRDAFLQACARQNPNVLSYESDGNTVRFSWQ